MAGEPYQRLSEKLWAAKGRYREVPVERLRVGMENWRNASGPATWPSAATRPVAV